MFTIISVGATSCFMRFLRHGGRRLRRAVEEALAAWLDGETELEELIVALGEVYRAGFAELAASLHAAGWRDRGSGLLDPVVEALHARRASTARLQETRLAVAALHQALATEPLFGPTFRRSAGMTSREAKDPMPMYRWWAHHLRTSLGLADFAPKQ